jgi:segregation and condensation protein A
MNLSINDFEGPLDLLLHLVKSSKMDIYEIDTSKVIEEYLNFINSIDTNDLDNASEYLVMAAELIHLKSRLLINIDNNDEEDNYEINTEEDLKNKLIEYEKYKDISEKLRTLEENRKDYYTKVPESINEYSDGIKIKSDGTITIDDLLKAFLELQKREEFHKPLETKITKKELSVKDKTNYIRKLLKNKKKIEFKDLFETYTKDNVIVTFLAILNMSKEQEIKILQKDNFSNIFIERVNL